MKCHRIETSELLFTALARPMVLSIVLLLGALIAGTSLLRRARYKNASPERRLIMDVEMIQKTSAGSVRMRLLTGDSCPIM